MYYSKNGASYFQVIECPEDLKDDYDSDLGDEVDTDGPNIVASRDGESLYSCHLLNTEHFKTGFI